MRSLFASAALLAASAGASAAVTFGVSTRSVTGIAQVPQTPAVTDTNSTTALGVYSHTANATANFALGGMSTGTATQNTEIGFDFISGAGSASANVIPGGGSQGGYTASSNSSMDITFHLDADTPYSLTGAINSFQLLSINNPQVYFRLSGGTLASPIEVVRQALSPQFINATLADSGILGAGDYHLVVSAVGGASNGFAQTGDFSFTLAVPAPGASLGTLAALGAARRRRA